jgi:hypothetical protein
MFRRINADLWSAARDAHPDYKKQRYDCWVLCPRAHAEAHLRCVIELSPRAYPGLPGMLWLAKEQFAQIGRYFPGDDLVFAVGTVQ